MGGKIIRVESEYVCAQMGWMRVWGDMGWRRGGREGWWRGGRGVYWWGVGVPGFRGNWFWFLVWLVGWLVSWLSGSSGFMWYHSDAVKGFIRINCADTAVGPFSCPISKRSRRRAETRYGRWGGVGFTLLMFSRSCRTGTPVGL